MLMFSTIHIMLCMVKKYGAKKIRKENYSKYLLQKVAWVSWFMSKDSNSKIHGIISQVKVLISLGTGSAVINFCLTCT